MQPRTLLLAVLAAAAAGLGAAPARAAPASAGLGTFVSTATGRWLYYDIDTDRIRFGSSRDPPPTVFRLSTAPGGDGLFRIQLAENGFYVSASEGGRGPATALPAADPGPFETFNLTAEADGAFFLRAANGAPADTRFSRADLFLNLVFDVPPLLAGLSATTFAWNPDPYASTPDGTLYRTFATPDSSPDALQYNVSTFLPAFTGPTGQMTAYTVKWTGDARQPARGLLMYLGGSDSRSNGVGFETEVLAKTQSTGLPLVLTTDRALAAAILDHYLLVVPLSPICYNTTADSWQRNDCRGIIGNHAIRHYRPEELKRIYDEVQQRFGFDTTRFALVGTSFGGRGGLRFLSQYPTLPAAATFIAGSLERPDSRYMTALPYRPGDPGEGCWDVTQPNVGGTCAPRDAIPATLDEPTASQLGGFPIRLWSSARDDIAPLVDAQDTCRLVNDAVVGGAALRGNCTVIETDARSHGSMTTFGRTVADVEWLRSYQRLPGQASQFVGLGTGGSSGGGSSGTGTGNSGGNSGGGGSSAARRRYPRSLLGSAMAHLVNRLTQH